MKNPRIALILSAWNYITEYGEIPDLESKRFIGHEEEISKDRNYSLVKSIQEFVGWSPEAFLDEILKAHKEDDDNA